MSLPDDVLNIDTPENVIFGYDVAGIGSRFLAALVDSIIILLSQIIVFATLFFVLSSIYGNLDDLDDSLMAWLMALIGLIAFGMLWGYYIFFELLWNGQSPGKRWVGLRVIRTDGTPITLSETIIRNLVRLVDFLPAYYGLGVVIMFINDQARRLGDLAAGTLVIRDQATVTLESLDTKTASRDLGLYAGQSIDLDLPVNRLTNADLRMAEEFLRRRYQLANRQQLAGQIMRALYQRMDLSPDGMYHNPEDVIRQIVKNHQTATETAADETTPNGPLT